MDRRTVLASFGTLTTTVTASGCLTDLDGTPADENEPSGEDGTETDENEFQSLPDDCPVNTLERFDLPDDLDQATAEKFVRRYETAYINQHYIDREQYDRVDGPGGSIEESTPVDDGYILQVTTGWATWRPDREVLEFERVTQPDADPVVVDDEALADTETLQELLSETIEDGSDAITENDRDFPSVYEHIETITDEVDGAVIEYRNETLEVTESAWPGAHGDHFKRAAYRIEPDILYRTEEIDSDPRDGEIVEC